MGAWEQLLAGSADQAPACQVRSLIGDSWQRCAHGGIDATQGEAPMTEDRDDREALRQSSVDLLAAAQRSFASIGTLLEGTGAMLVLADNEGVLVETIGDKRTLYEGMDIHLAVGGKWTEDVVGTNGIGTALFAGEPVFVHAAEHFCAGIKGWTCAGAPIRDPLDGRIVGVVDLSGHPGSFARTTPPSSRRPRARSRRPLPNSRARNARACLRRSLPPHPTTAAPTA